MATTDLQSFVNAVDTAIQEAIDQGIDAEQVEKVLQKRAQDMREYAADADDD